MGTVLVLALSANTGTGHFRKAVDVYCLDAQLCLQFTAYAPSPGLGTEETDTQFEVFLLDAAFLHDLCQVQGIGRGTAQCRGAEVLHEHDLFLGIAGRGGQLYGTDFSRTVVCAKSAREQTITIGHLYHIAGTYIANGKHASHTLRPVVKVVLRVGAHHGLSRSTRRGMYALYLAHGHCLKAIGILVAQIVLGGKGKFCYIVYGLDILWADTLLVHFLSVKRHVLIAALYRGNETLALQFAHLLARHAFYFRIEYHSCLKL